MNTAAEIIEWIGADPDRARQAHDTELERPKPRKGVLDHIAATLRAADPVVYRNIRDGRVVPLSGDPDELAQYEAHPRWVRV